MKKNNIFWVFLFFWMAQAAQRPHLGICAVPVADLLGQPMKSIFNDDATAEHYQKISASPHQHSKQNALYACQRIHQILLHDIIEIIDESDDEICIRLYNTFYNDARNNRANTFWTLKKYITDVSDGDYDKVPSTVSFDSSLSTVGSSNIFILLYPFLNPQTNTLYSAGTRFVLAEQTNDEPWHTVYCFDTDHTTFMRLNIPRSLGILNTADYAREHKRALFMTIAKLWTGDHQHLAHIPFVWGGASYLQLHPSQDFTQETMTTPDREHISAYFRKNSPGEDLSASIQSGFDASNLVLKIAQLCSIPYFYKNTSTAHAYLQPISSIDDLESGDILWVPGGMSIVDKEHNSLISARGYSAGYGIVHELPLSALFKGITTFSDIFSALATGTSLEYLNAHGEIITTYKQAMFLKLPV